MTFRIAVVQPICHRPGTDENNVARTQSWRADFRAVPIDPAPTRTTSPKRWRSLLPQPRKARISSASRRPIPARGGCR